MRLWPSQATASVQAVFKDFRPPFSFVNGQYSTMCNIDWTWPHSQFGLSRRPHLCSVSAHIPWPDLYRFSIDHFRRSRLNPGNGIVGSDTICLFGTMALSNFSRHSVFTLKSSSGILTHIGRLDSRRVLGWSKKSAYRVSCGVACTFAASSHLRC